MAWTAATTAINVSGANVVVTVRFSQNGENIDRDFPGNDLTAGKLKDLVLKFVQLLEERDRAKATHAIGPITFR